MSGFHSYTQVRALAQKWGAWGVIAFFLVVHSVFEVRVYLLASRIWREPALTHATWMTKDCKKDGCMITWPDGTGGHYSTSAVNLTICSHPPYPIFASKYNSPLRFPTWWPEGPPILFQQNNPTRACIGSYLPPAATFRVTAWIIASTIWLLLGPLLHGSLRSRIANSKMNPMPYLLGRLGKIGLTFPRRAAYNVHLYGMLITLFRSDGYLDDDEKVMLAEMGEEIVRSARSEQQIALLAAMRDARASKLPFREHALRFTSTVRKNPAALHLALDWLLAAASANGVLDPREVQLLMQAADIFEIPRATVQSGIEEIMKGSDGRKGTGEHSDSSTDSGSRRSESDSRGSGPQSPLGWAYQELNCRPGDSLDAIKKKYREAAKQYHPDRLRSQGLPPEVLRSAERKFLSIQRAYEALSG